MQLEYACHFIWIPLWSLQRLVFPSFQLVSGVIGCVAGVSGWSQMLSLAIMKWEWKKEWLSSSSACWDGPSISNQWSDPCWQPECYNLLTGASLPPHVWQREVTSHPFALCELSAIIGLWSEMVGKIQDPSCQYLYTLKHIQYALCQNRSSDLLLLMKHSSAPKYEQRSW